jgi:hypothetical protein
VSKNSRYENPYAVKGSIKQAGLKELPKGIYADRTIGTWKADNAKDLFLMMR